MIYIENSSQNPAFNLALEEYLVTTQGRFAHEDIALLWKNQPTVVVGRNQNAHREINRTYLDEHNIRVVRRLSGGGAVYHDQGNINFTVIKRNAHALKNNFSFFTEPLVNTLAEFGVQAEFSGRNDVLVKGAKFSGNAQYSYQDTLLHHGTILFDSDLSVLGKVLTPKPRVEDYTTRGIMSHRSRVANLSQFLMMDLPEFHSAFAQNLMESNGGADDYFVLDEEEAVAVSKLCDSKYATTEWTWGKSPEYDFINQARFDAGNVTVCGSFVGGFIERLDFYGDFFEVGPIEQYSHLFEGKSMNLLKSIIDANDVGNFIHGFSNDELLTLLTEQLNSLL